MIESGQQIPNRAELLSRVKLGNLQRAIYALFFLLGLAWTLYLSANSAGVPVQDEIGHFLLSKSAWQHPQHLLNLWGRPFRTLIYMLPSVEGLGMARLFSIFMASLTVLAATGLARTLGVGYLFLIPLFIWFQPWVNNLTFAVLPQVPFALFLTLGTYLWSINKIRPASLVFGLLPLMRHEAIALTGCWMLYLVVRQRWRSIAITLAPLLLFNLAFYAILGRPAYEIFLSARPTTLYGSGDWLHFVRPLPDNVGWPLLLLSFIGWIPLIRRRRAHILSGYMLYFLVHVFIFRFGLFASGGYQLFLLPVAPAFAILGALGLEYALGWPGKALDTRHAQFNKAWHTGLSAIVMAGFTLAILFAGLKTRPIPLDPEGVALRAASDWLKDADIEYDKIVSTHVWFYYFNEMVVVPGAGWAAPPPVENLPESTVVIWDERYSDRWGLSQNYLANPANGWSELVSFGEDQNAVVYYKDRQN